MAAGFQYSRMDYQPTFLRSLSLDRQAIPRPSLQPKQVLREFQTFCQADPFDHAMVPGG